MKLNQDIIPIQRLKTSELLSLPEAKFYTKLILFSIALESPVIETSWYKLVSSLYSWSGKTKGRVVKYLYRLQGVEFVTLKGKGNLLNIEPSDLGKIKIVLPQEIIEVFKEINCESNFVKILTGGKIW